MVSGMMRELSDSMNCWRKSKRIRPVWLVRGLMTGTNQMDWKDFNDTIESRRKRRKVTPDSKVHVANELEAEGNSDSESESDSK
jgi:hypothetical protein